MTDHDDELFARLRDGDPAASLPAADRQRVTRLLEEAMSNDTELGATTESRETGTRGRSPLTWLVAAAAVVLIAAAGAFALVDRGSDPAVPTAGPTAGDTGSETGGAPTVTELAMPGTTTGRCMVPNAQLLATAAYAVDAEVVSVADGVVTLEATQWYSGDATDQVLVDQSSADMQMLVGATDFQEGQRYLVAGTDDGQVMVCGFSGPWTDDLAALYSEAFGS